MRPDIAAIHAAARHARAVEMHRLLFAPIAAWFRRPKKQELRVAACPS